MRPTQPIVLYYVPCISSFSLFISNSYDITNDSAKVSFNFFQLFSSIEYFYRSNSIIGLGTLTLVDTAKSSQYSEG